MDRDCSMDIAVTGIFARLPGLNTIHQWWSDLIEGKVITTRYTPDELSKIGVSDKLLKDPNFVPIHGHLSDSDRFDNKFFKISPREAEMMDPQHRLMLEAAWAALEDAGYGNTMTRPLTAVFASNSGSGYLRSMLSHGPLEPDILEQALHGTEPDFIASLIAYKLNLTGPAIAVQTACSSSLVGVHLAVQSLLNGDCDQAIIVAAGIAFPQGGHLYMAGGIKSPTGMCRPFDHHADGVVEGSGVACIVLRRLNDAINDNSDIYGVILGTAINNDGAAKAGYYAPSVSGQVAVMQMALQTANIDASTVGYLETHGTGTQIGDPIEWSAATEAYSAMGATPGQIAIGTLKANIGHTDAAAGLAGLIKALYVVKTGIICPVAGLNTLNPLLGSEGSPLYAPLKKRLWETEQPRRAGVSAFGIGGTNAHIIIEQPPAPSQTSSHKEDLHLVALSAVDEEALLRAEKNLQEHLLKNSANIADIAYTLSRGRTNFSKRWALCAQSSEELIQSLIKRENIIRNNADIGVTRPLIFLFPGQGSQYPGMALPFTKFPYFNETMNACLAVFKPTISNQLQRALFDASFSIEELNETKLAQPALFALEYTIACCLKKLGVIPSAVIGHSLGEISAACHAGAIDLYDAVALVTARGEAMQDCHKGAMLAINADAEVVQTLLLRLKLSLTISAINTLNSCVVSGELTEIEAFQKLLAGRFKTRILMANRAFHSSMVESAMPTLEEAMEKIRLDQVKFPLALNVSGHILEKGDVLKKTNFLNQARNPVLFSEGIASLNKKFKDAIYLEVGPGRILSSMVSSMNLKSITLSETQTDFSGREVLSTIGELWTLGYPVALNVVCSNGRRIHLPTYPFYGPKWLAPEAAAGLKLDTARGERLSKNHNEIEIDKQFSEVMSEKNVIEKLKIIWKELFCFNEIDEALDFFEIGGDSMMMISLISKIQRTFNIQVPPRKILTAKTLNSQASIIYELLSQCNLQEGVVV